MGRASNVRLAVSSPHCWALASGESVARAAISRNADKMILLDSVVGEGAMRGFGSASGVKTRRPLPVRSQCDLRGDPPSVATNWQGFCHGPIALSTRPLPSSHYDAGARERSWLGPGADETTGRRAGR